MLVALVLFLQFGLRRRSGRLARGTTHRAGHWIWTAGSGLVLGFLVGVTSVGSGTLFGVLLLVVFGLTPRAMVGTDVYHAAILTTAAAAAHVWASHVNYGLVAKLLLGSIPGVLLGSKLATRIPEKMLRPVLASILFLAGLRMI